MYRDHTKVVKIGDRVIGGGNPILIQSMTNTRTEDVKATVEQIHRLTEAGCEIIRCTVPTKEAAEAIKEIKKQITIPLVADIHFDYKMAIAAMENGADKIRINPGNIGSLDRIKAVVDTARERNIPIRVGVNSGSLEKELVEKYHGVTAEGIVESALDKVKISFADLISSTGSPVRETRIVSPIPWLKISPSPMEDLIFPASSVPDSVMPTCNGYGHTGARSSCAFTHIITSDDLILTTRLSYPISSIICTLSSALSTRPSAVTP